MSSYSLLDVFANDSVGFDSGYELGVELSHDICIPILKGEQVIVMEDPTTKNKKLPKATKCNPHLQAIHRKPSS